MEAEERGQGEAIARSLYELSVLKVPVLSIIIGEGGSGGALAFAWRTRSGWWSMRFIRFFPRSFASILWKDSSRAREAAKVMGLTADQLKKQGMVEEVIPEERPLTLETFRSGGRHAGRNPSVSDTYGTFSEEELLAHRWERFRTK